MFCELCQKSQRYNFIAVYSSEDLFIPKELEKRRKRKILLRRFHFLPNLHQRNIWVTTQLYPTLQNTTQLDYSPYPFSFFLFIESTKSPGTCLAQLQKLLQTTLLTHAPFEVPRIALIQRKICASFLFFSRYIVYITTRQHTRVVVYNVSRAVAKAMVCIIQYTNLNLLAE